MVGKHQKIIRDIVPELESLGSIDATIAPRREDNSEMSKMQIGKNNQSSKNHTTSTKTTLVLSCVLAVLCVSLITSGVEAKSKFKIEVQICCASSDSGSVKIKVKLPDGSSTSKKVNLGKLAEAQDWDNVAVFLKLKHRYESFKVCVSGQGCQWGEAGDPVQFKGY